jgi:hypothetical protein
MDLDWSRELLDQLEWHWQNHLRPRLDGLTDEEYLWEPVPHCWSLRPRSEATTSMAAGAGEVVADFAYPEPVPAPFTTIAWRMAHVAIGVLGMRAANHFGEGGVDYQTTEWSLTAVDGLALLDHHYDAWITGVRGLDESGLARPCGPAEGPFSEYPMATLVLHISRETIHHGAEITLLRDLYMHSDADARA